MRRTRSIVSWTAGIHFLRYGFKDRGLDLSVMVGCFPGRVTLQAAIFCCFRDLYRLSDSLPQAFRNVSISASVVECPRLSRIAPRVSSASIPMAASTWEGVTLPDEQAAPEETATPSRSRAITAVS